MQQIVTCQSTGESFEVSDLEISLRKKFGFENFPETSPLLRLRHLGAFWQHWNLHNRKCDKTGTPIVSVFSENCPYPVWHKEEWMKNANPPSRDFDSEKSFFEQAWEVFQDSPIPHNFQSQNQNCEYTDDWYRSKNCYLSHSGQNNQDCRYCYGCDSVQNLFWSAFSFNSEFCADLLNSRNCFQSFYLVNCRNVSDSSFLYDCRNCSDCMFCYNLRNKKYCFGNVQLTKEQYEKKKQEWDFSSQKTYIKAKQFFAKMMKEIAWHRSLQIDLSQNSFGNFLNQTKDCHNCYLITKHEEAANVIFSGPGAKTLLDCFGTVGAEQAYSSILPVYSYDVQFCFSVDNSKMCMYSAFLKNCKNCFGCCGLVNKEYCIFNKQYSPEEYEQKKTEIIQHMKQSGEWGEFFPGYFAPSPYDESISGFYWPLTQEEQKNSGFRISEETKRTKPASFQNISEIPDSSKNADEELTKIRFWDEKFSKPFQISAADINFCKRIGIPLPHSFYINRLQENFQWMFSVGSLRKTNCAKSGKEIFTYWPKEYDTKILCEDEYLKVVQ